jgi:hypothetical protein
VAARREWENSQRYTASTEADEPLQNSNAKPWFALEPGQHHAGRPFTGFVDPLITFDPGFDSSGFQLVFNDGVGNKPAAAVPGPIAGAGLPGLVMTLGGLVILSRRRRNQAVVA